MVIKTLRALAMTTIVTEDLTPDSYPEILLKEIQTLKELQNISLNQQSCWGKQYLLLNLRWGEWMDARMDYLLSYIDEEYIPKYPELEVAGEWVRKIRTEITKQMEENSENDSKLWKTLPLEYHSMNFKNMEKDNNTLVHEMKQRLFDLIEEDYQRKRMMIKRKMYGAMDDTLNLLLQKRSFARNVINCMNFTI